MEPHYQDDLVTIYNTDCKELMRELPECSIDAIVCDPPYGLEFMGKEWDKLTEANGFRRAENDADVGRKNVFGRISRTSPEYKLGGAGIEKDAKSAGGFGKDSPTNENAYAAARIRYGKSTANMQEWHQEWATEALRVLKPGGHALVFGGTRTHHRLMCGLEDAGFEIRDCVMWVYGSGFPKSLDVSKAIDKAAGAEREVYARLDRSGPQGSIIAQCSQAKEYIYSHPSTDAAKAWDGWGTALKPAWEPIIVARKPLEGTVVENVLKYGTGALNIDGCRVEGPKGNGVWGSSNKTCQGGRTFNASPRGEEYRSEQNDKGRWPANLIHDGSDEVVSLFPQQTSGANPTRRGPSTFGGGFIGQDECDPARGAESGSAARFFYTAKASGSDRGNQTDPALPLFGIEQEEFRNTHPTVKPLALMRYLLTLVCPPGALVLDPFAGSGSTGCAAKELGIKIILAELELEYCDIAARRAASTRRIS